jgi:carboxymethylenebutenolidase
VKVRHVLLPSLLLLLCPLSPGPAPAADPPVSAESIEYAGSEGEMPARLYRRPGAGRGPGVLVLHTVAGPGPNVEAFARELAGAGFVALTPDLFSLPEFGADGRTDHPLVLGDLAGAFARLARHPAVDPERLGVVGFSFGGRLAVILAATEPARVRAAVVYYAIASHQALGRPLAGRAATARPLTERVGAIRAAVLIHHGDADTSVPVDQARLLHRALLAAGKSSTLHVYPGADHLFNFALGPDVRYHPQAARLSWERTLGFLQHHVAASR